MAYRDHGGRSETHAIVGRPQVATTGVQPPAQLHDQTGGWQLGALVGALMGGAGGGAPVGGPPVMFVNHLTVNINNNRPHADGGGRTHADDRLQPAHFQANDPPFQMAYYVQGLDFGNNWVSQFFKALKHVHAQYRMITYTRLCHGRSGRSKYVVVFFDCDETFQRLANEWADTIKLAQIKSMLCRLGSAYDCHRDKVRKQRFSLYLYVVKPHGVQFSQWGSRTWSNLFTWAHHSLQDSATLDNAGPVLLNPEVISQVLGVGLALAGAV